MNNMVESPLDSIQEGSGTNFEDLNMRSNNMQQDIMKLLKGKNPTISSIAAISSKKDQDSILFVGNSYSTNDYNPKVSLLIFWIIDTGATNHISPVQDIYIFYACFI